MPTSRAPDVIIVGAGVVGCSIAYHLARAGAAVTVLDQGDICNGMSARSGAIIRMHYSFAPEAELAWKSLRYFTNWRDMVGGECGFVKTGFAVVVGPENTARLSANAAMLQGLGIEVSLIDRKQLREQDPAVNVDDIALAAYEPESGYADPIATTRSFAQAAAQRGATFMLHSVVTAIDRRGSHATGVKVAAAQPLIAAAICIVAGPWTDRLLKPFGVQIGIKAERAQIAFFRRDSATRHLAYIDTIAGSYCRPHGNGLTLAGLGEWHPGGEPDPDDYRESNDTAFVEEAARRLTHRIPCMRGASYAQGHAGIYDQSPDSRAVMGKVPGVEGLYVAAGFSGTGFKTAPAVGAAMAELILSGRSQTVDISPFGFERLLSGRLIRTANEYTMGAGFGHTL
jgi:sarcosine oxidase, subunit beta